ncbi:MAG: hypothetical protein KME20_09970 [Kaiparowitsia implicata GSE-PSE-MK54-09C]|nr:hypothetical protein [Kaiparowitsia implicata GSE-PSE-MK54-09C]
MTSPPIRVQFVEQRPLRYGGRHQVLRDDAGLGATEARLPYRIHRTPGRLDRRQAVVRRLRDVHEEPSRWQAVLIDKQQEKTGSDPA